MEGEAESALEKHMGEVMLGFVNRNLQPVRDWIELVDDGEEIIPGVTAHLAPGHTPGQIALQVESQGEKFLYLVDALLHPIHCEHPEWFAIVDMDKEKTVKTRMEFLTKAANEKMLTMFFHFDFPGLGYVIKKGESWIWEPIAIE
jgi:glyoxylase-like metal-dependent hydrolase (beta-lactamase superfamily II)